MTSRHPKNSLRGRARTSMSEIQLTLFTQDQLTLKAALTHLREMIPSHFSGIFSIFIT